MFKKASQKMLPQIANYMDMPKRKIIIKYLILPNLGISPYLNGS